MIPADLLRRRIRCWLSLFLLGLVLSGVTAIPLAWELDVLARLVGPGDSGLALWIGRVQGGLHEAYARYPFLAYGTDWLAFGHLMIAVAFLGPLRDPVRNRWVLTFGMIACICVVPWALVFGALRGIPFFWRLIDCSFGIVGIVPLWFCRRDIDELERSEPGRIVGQSPLFTPDVLLGDVALGDGQGTLFTRSGDWLVYACLAVVCCSLLARFRPQRKPKV